MEKDYRVMWEIDLCADSPEAAAQLAWDIQHEDSPADHFEVIDLETGESVSINLSEVEEAEAQAVKLEYMKGERK
ncbi:hypothetical protein LCGC14_2893780 [marine sediment metagenome]|uniref:Uncharacterized protein n=1 Tax=marine sediment metagenome TaxID=412755 RepID=A0A0F8YI93_9ZZZZ